METCRLKKVDIQRMWSQIVSQTGIDKYSHAEWQENYEDFWKCMLSPSEPYIKIQSIEELTGTRNNNLQPPTAKQKISQVKPKAAKQRPWKMPGVSDSISMLRIPRIKPGQQSTKMVTEPLESKKHKQPNLSHGQQDISHIEQVSPEQTVQAQPETTTNISVQWQQQQATPQNEQCIDQTAFQVQEQHSDVTPRLLKDAWVKEQQQEEECKLQPQPANVQQLLVKEQLQNSRQLPPKAPEPQMKAYQRPYPDRSRPYQNFLGNSSDNSNQSTINSRQKSHEDGPNDSGQKARRQRKMVFKSSSGQVYNLKVTKNERVDDSKGESEAGSDCELENKLIADALQLANKVCKDYETRKAIKTSPDMLLNNEEKIDHWLQNFDDRASRAIEHNIADTSDFFKNLPNLVTVIGKTSHELKAILHNVIICGDMEAHKTNDRHIQNRSYSTVRPHSSQMKSKIQKT